MPKMFIETVPIIRTLSNHEACNHEVEAIEASTIIKYKSVCSDDINYYKCIMN